MRPPSEAHGILAHYFCADEATRTQGAITVDQWQRGLDAYGSRLISADAWIRLALARELSDEVCVTFDDGLREALVYALPALTERGLTAAWNVYTQPFVGVPHSLERWRWVRNQAFGSLESFYRVWALQVARVGWRMPADYLADRGYLTADDRAFRYWRNHCVTSAEYERVMTQLEHQSGQAWAPHAHWLTPSDVRDLFIDGHVIGLHGHRHPTTLAGLSDEDQAVEYATCRYMLSVYADVHTASYPCGQISDAAVTWFQANGIDLAWGATMKGSIPWECPRWSTGYWTP